MDLTSADFERIPGENLRVPREEFVAVWRLAERMAHDDWYAVGVVKTCRWMACASVPSIIPALKGRLVPARAPVTGRRARAHPELIQDEAEAADVRLARYPSGVEGRPGWLEAIAATLDWAWRGSGRAPLDVRQADAG